MDTKEFYKHNEELRGKNINIDMELKSFNWGAFGLGWFWGLFNGAFHKTFFPWLIICILSVISAPDFIVYCAAILLMIYYGFKGNIWAWNGLRSNDIIRFKKIQKIWASVTIVIYIAIITVVTLSALNIIPKISMSDSRYIFTNRAIVREITKDNTLKYAPDGEYVATQIAERYNSKSKTQKRRYDLYNHNIVVLKKYNTTVRKYEIEGAILFSKQIRCSLKLKNCSITFYKNENNRFIMKEKTYFDHKGKTFRINYDENK